MTATQTPNSAAARRASPQAQPCRPGVVLHDISWRCYEMLLDELAEQHMQINYDAGELELMPPLPLHERWKKLIAFLVAGLAAELKIPLGMLGSTTFRREDIAKGIEPDECFYVQNELRLRGRLEIDLSVDPPPDLAIEIDITRSSIDRQAIYAGLKIPEVWRFNARRLQFLRLSEDGSYKPCEYSLAFPMLARADLERFLLSWDSVDDITFVEQFREWVRTNLKR
ncbi:MAG TPA: Uma2 family endonuclease [Tepidisphaeraceae bacterium]|jgi:Uma2 family endonuclease|nr:Uma2 family endonuclease [Tepidisphaeraceae bacterium]